MLKKLNKLILKIYDIMPVLFNALYDIGALAFAFQLGIFFKISYGVAVFIALEALHFLKVPQTMFTNPNIIATLVTAAGTFYPLYLLFRYEQTIIEVIPYKSVKFLFLTNYIMTIMLISGIICALIAKKFDGFKRFLRALFVAGGLLFVLFIYLPTDSFVSNYDQFEMTYSMFIGNYLLAYATYAVPSVFVLTCIQGERFTHVADVLSGVMLAMYVQFTFLNNELGLLGTSDAGLNERIPLLIFNALIWALIIAVPSAVRHISKNKLGKLSTGVGFFTIALVLVSYVLTLTMAPSDVFNLTSEFYFDPSDQYVLSANKNVVVFVWDAYDESYIDYNLLENPDLFDELNDFTVYTDACSVYDSTVTSMNQMFGGCTFDNTLTFNDWSNNGWNSDNTIKFYSDLHDNGYVVNAYNFPSHHLECIDGKIDNLYRYDTPKPLEVDDFDYDDFNKSMKALTLYRAFPYIVKQFIPINEYNYKNFVIYKDIEDADYQNLDFLNNMNLSLGDFDSCISIQHLNGTHLPNDPVISSQECLTLLAEYCDQLKELGIYDKTTIIILSDHGEHHEGLSSQPIFMIKEADTVHSEMMFDSSPVYHEDIIGTIAVNAGLCTASSNPYGTSIYDFNESSVRTRIWYDRVRNDSYPTVYNTGHLSYAGIYNTYYAYEFEGPYENLWARTVEELEPTEIYPMREYFG